ncbi:hypothetical protein BURK2_03373 [Burkholderiales bacterium]|nr:hypothetical protein BURK2_03373 [Burkholderiales bacterium]
MSAERSHLPHWLAAIYALLIAYASLQPFSGWQGNEGPFFLFSGWGRYTSFDILANVCAYLPLGFFAALLGRRSPAAVLLAAALALVLSFSLETLQWFLPSRAASPIDLLANGLGGLLGGIGGAALRQHPLAGTRLIQWRAAVFITGRGSDAGLALLAIWLLLQLNPAIPLFGATYQPETDTPVDAVGVIIEAAQSALNVLGVGLFLASLLRRRAHLGAAVLLLVGIGLALKAAAAVLVIKPALWDYWLRPGVGIGVALGAVLLLALVWTTRRSQTLLGAIALLSGLLVPLLAPEVALAAAPLALFNWNYGHLLNFNGLTRSGLLVWPLAAAAQLILAGTGSRGDRGDPV